MQEGRFVDSSITSLIVVEKKAPKLIQRKSRVFLWLMVVCFGLAMCLIFTPLPNQLDTVKLVILLFLFSGGAVLLVVHACEGSRSHDSGFDRQHALPSHGRNRPCPIPAQGPGFPAFPCGPRTGRTKIDAYHAGSHACVQSVRSRANLRF